MTEGQLLPDNWSFDDLEVDLSGSIKSEEDVLAPQFPAEGIFHAVIADVNCNNEKAPGSVFLVFEILEGNVEGQEGKTTRHVIWAPSAEARNPEAAVARWTKHVAQFMLAVGLRKSGEFPKVKFTQDFWNACEGKMCMVRITHSEDTRTTEAGKTYTMTNASVVRPSDLIPMFHESVKEVKYDVDAAKLAGYISEGSSKDEV